MNYSIKSARLLLLSVACCLLTLGCRARSPSGKYISHVRLPTGMEFIETADFRSSGTCYFGTPPTIAECQWSRQGDTITIERNGLVLTKLRFEGLGQIYITYVI
jgi:hypothetical protein